MTATRAPCAVEKANFVPTPGRRVSRSSDGIGSLLQSRRREEGAAQALRLLHEDDAERGGGEDVEAGEGGEVGAVGGGDGVVGGDDLGEDDRELAVRDERGADVEALAVCEAADEACTEAAGELPGERKHDGDGHEPADPPERAHVDGEPEDEEEERCEEIAEREEALLDLLSHARLGEDDAGHESTDRLGEPELAGGCAHADEEGEREEEHELARQTVEEDVERSAE